MSARLPTLRFRLAVRAFAYTVLALSFVGVSSWFAIDRIVLERITTSAEDYLLTLTGELDIASSPTDANVVAPISQAGEDRLAQIIRLENNEVVVATRGFGTSPLVDASALSGDPITTLEVPHPDREEDRILLKSTTVSVGGENFGVVAGISFGSSVFESDAMGLAVVGAGLVLALGLAAGVWLSVRSAMRPVEDLANEAGRVASSANTKTWALENLATTAEIDHLIERLNSLLSRVHESQENERAFLEDASHDLRTPIAVARAELDLARSTTSEETTRQALESSIEELDRLDRLSADLLILARMRARPTGAVENIHVGHLVRKTAARFMRDPLHRDLRLTVEGNAETLGDPFMVERAIDNVLSNAIKHASERVEIEVGTSGGMVSIRVSDDGPGFPDGLLSSAAKRFERETSHAEGTGLGLSIAAAITEAHGGSLRFSNRPDGGAEVVLSLPTGKGGDEFDHAAPERSRLDSGA
jgi:two-component system OmpR family sensor kinase